MTTKTIGNAVAAARARRVHISTGNSKLGRMLNWSLTPGETCSREACATCLRTGCYAAKLARLRPSVRDAWADNTWAAKHAPTTWDSAIRACLDANPAAVVRIHTAGDFFSAPYLLRWARIAADYPRAHLYAFTKQWRVIRAGLRALGRRWPRNLRVILSAWTNPDGSIVAPPADLRRRWPVAWVQLPRLPIPTQARKPFLCPGNCDSCGFCADASRASGDVVFHKH